MSSDDDTTEIRRLQEKIREELANLDVVLSENRYADCVDCAYNYKKCFAGASSISCSVVLDGRVVLKTQEDLKDIGVIITQLKAYIDELAIVVAVNSCHN